MGHIVTDWAFNISCDPWDMWSEWWEGQQKDNDKYKDKDNDNDKEKCI